MGQIWLWNLGFMAELWGKNSATDQSFTPYNPYSCPHSLLPRFSANSLPYVIPLEPGQGA